MVWEALKAVFRGKIRAFSSSKKKQKQFKLSELNRELKSWKQNTKNLTQILR